MASLQPVRRGFVSAAASQSKRARASTERTAKGRTGEGGETPRTGAGDRIGSTHPTVARALEGAVCAWLRHARIPPRARGRKRGGHRCTLRLGVQRNLRAVPSRLSRRWPSRKGGSDHNYSYISHYF
eukprot:6189217-Pleurochrysis_carterae.AAC.1